MPDVYDARGWNVSPEMNESMVGIHEPVTSSEEAVEPTRNSGWFNRVCQWWDHLWQRGPEPKSKKQSVPVVAPSVPTPLELLPLEYVGMTEGVHETLFEEYQEHRRSDRGQEEIGWLLLGTREADHVIIRATLPAGTQRDASRTHVRFNSMGQIIGSYFVRQHDRRLTTLGVAHTHPGNMNKPSRGDYRGDLKWVEQLRGDEGVFAIGTVQKNRTNFANSSPSRVQWGDGLCFDWYSLRAKAWNYRPLETQIVDGVDLARPLHPLWATIEEQGTALEQLFHQQSRVRAEVLEMDSPTLVVSVSLVDQQAIRIALTNDDVKYYVEQEGDIIEVEGLSTNVAQATYSLMAELAVRE